MFTEHYKAVPLIIQVVQMVHNSEANSFFFLSSTNCLLDIAVMDFALLSQYSSTR